MHYDAHWTAISALCHNIGRISRYAAHCASSDALRQPTCRDIHRISQHPTRVATAQHVRHITAPTQPHVAMSAMSRHAAATCCPHIATAPPHPPALITAPPDPSRTPSRYRDTPPQYRDTHAQSRSHGPGAPTRKCPALVPRPPGSAAPPSRRTVPARTAALVPFRRPRDRRRRLTTSSRRARAREREGGVTWAAAASRGGGRRARDAGRAHSAPFRRSQSERGGRGLARGAGPEERGGASAPTRVCGSSLGVGGALGELGWGHEWC